MKGRRNIPMEKSQYDELKRMQKTHWWFRGKQEIVMDVYLRYCKKSSSAKVLDVGCGMGLMLEELNDLCTIYGMDIAPEAVEYCRESFDNSIVKEHILCGSLPDDIPFTEKFDTVIGLDVLEHIKKDGKAISCIYDILNDGGIFLITVPALMSMWSGNDELNHHYRRYEKSELEQKISDAGFIIEKSSYYNSFLFLPAYIVRKIKNICHIVSSDVSINAKDNIINRALWKIFASEKRFLKKRNFRIGVSLIMVARKPFKAI